MKPALRLLLTLVCASPIPASAQSVIYSIQVVSDFPMTLGQARLGRVVVTEHDFNQARLYGYTGLLHKAMGGLEWGCRAVENTDGTLFRTGINFSPPLTREDGVSITLPEGCYSRHLVPLDDGKVLLAIVCCSTINCPDPSPAFRIYDRNLNLVGSFPGPDKTMVAGMTRRPDGSIVVSSQAASGARLTAYTLDGTVLWDRSVPLRGPVASDAAGDVYMLVAEDMIHVHNSLGVFDHAWGGPANQPLSYTKDIASSPNGLHLAVLSGYIGGPVRVHGFLPTPTVATSWGRLKALYRGAGASASD